MDINGDGRISFDEMMAVAKECLAAERAAAASGGARDPTVKAALDRFQAYLLQYSVRGWPSYQPHAGCVPRYSWVVLLLAVHTANMCCRQLQCGVQCDLPQTDVHL